MGRASGFEGPPVLIEAWVALLSAHARLVPRVDEDLRAACGIPLAWFDILRELGGLPDHEQRMQDLATAAGMSKSWLTRLVDRLEEAGLTSRRPVPGDRRSVRVRLTQAGADLVEPARAAVEESVRRHFGSHLSPAELAVLRDALGRFTGG